MGFEHQIKIAQKLCGDWKKTDMGFRDQFVSVKKDSLKIDKTEIRKLQSRINSGLNDEKEVRECADEIAQTRANIEKYFRFCEDVFKRHNDWFLKEPRQSMGFIAKKFALGKPGDPAYDAVAKGIKRELGDVSKEVQETQRVWKKDLMFALKVHLNALDSMEKMLKNDRKKIEILNEQVQKDILEYYAMCDDRLATIDSKRSGDEAKLMQVKTGKLDREKKRSHEQDLQRFQNLHENIPKYGAQATKNYARILKSLPKGFKIRFSKTKDYAQLQRQHVDFSKKLMSHSKFYANLIKEYDIFLKSLG